LVICAISEGWWLEACIPARVRRDGVGKSDANALSVLGTIDNRTVCVPPVQPIRLAEAVITKQSGCTRPIAALQ
jgi:hypothetical protein